jgi:hypothetical protein
MHKQTAQRLIEALETGLMANPELQVQADPCKRGIWRELVGNALRDMRAELGLTLNARQLELMYRCVHYMSSAHNTILDLQRAGVQIPIPKSEEQLLADIGEIGTDLLFTLRELATKSSIAELTL